MRIDHVVYAAGPEGMTATAHHLAGRLGVAPHDGGVHPRFGTRNMVLPLADERYLEVVEVLDHPASDKAPFGQAVRARSERGGGWMAWVVACEDLSDIEARLGRDAAPGHRVTPEGVDLTWRQIGIKGLLADPQLPFFLRWDSLEHHPSTLEDSDVRLATLSIAGDADRVRDWLGLDDASREWERDVEFEFLDDQPPALQWVTFETADGRVRI